MNLITPYSHSATHASFLGYSGSFFWIEYMKSYASQFPPIEFTIPEGVVRKKIDIATQVSLGVRETGKKPLEDIELNFFEENLE